ncbi:MAG: zinc ribbon domain-containing protein [Phycisphaerales bacterium]|nr:zinc ribbon domain-containing protein [Phycisphaerales bacterium]
MLYIVLVGMAAMVFTAAMLALHFRRAARSAGLSVHVDWVRVLTHSHRYALRSAWRWHFIRRFSLFGVFATVVSSGVVLAIVPASGRVLSRSARAIGLDPVAESLVFALAITSALMLSLMLFSYAHQHAIRVCQARGRVCPRCAYGLAELAESDEIVCPECGYRTTPGQLVRDWQSLAYLPSGPFPESSKGQ